MNTRGHPGNTDSDFSHADYKTQHTSHPNQLIIAVAMAWDAETIIQLIGVLISILSIGIACYNHQSIVAAGRRICSMFSCRKTYPRPEQ